MSICCKLSTHHVGCCWNQCQELGPGKQLPWKMEVHNGKQWRHPLYAARSPCTSSLPPADAKFIVWEILRKGWSCKKQASRIAEKGREHSAHHRSPRAGDQKILLRKWTASEERHLHAAICVGAATKRAARNLSSAKQQRLHNCHTWACEDAELSVWNLAPYWKSMNIR